MEKDFKTEKLLKKLKITEEGLQKIKTAVSEAEKTTNGEIACAIIRQSDDYSFFEFFAAFMFSIICTGLLLPLARNVKEMLETYFWFPPAAYLPAVYVLTFISLTFLFFAVANIPFLDRLIIPKAIRERKVYERAIRHFAESGVYRTKQNSGVLIFVSSKERCVTVLADSGIAAKIEQKEWKEICSNLVKGIKAGRTEESLCEAIKRCGEILSASFPEVGGKPNELKDGLTVLSS